MLSEFLDIKKGDVISFVGAGGKTSLMLSLANELAPNYKVIVTTTTKMGLDEVPKDFKMICINDNKDTYQIDLLPNKPKKPTFIYKCVENGKTIGIGDELVSSTSKNADVVLVEADGSRKLPIKVPKDTEPVIPSCATKMVVVYGFDGMDKPINDDIFYNLEGFEKRIDKSIRGEILSPAILRNIFIDGGFIESAKGGKIYLIINKSDLGMNRAEEFCRYLYHDTISSVGISSAKEGWIKKIDNNNRKIKGIILAAGESKRFKEPKQMVEINGQSMLERVIESASTPYLDGSILILGSHREEILTRIDNDLLGKIAVKINPDFESGIASSIKCGIGEASDADAVMIILADMPGVDRALIEKICKSYLESCAWVCRPIIDGIPGHPVIIGKELIKDLYEIKGDKGPRDILNNVKEMTLFINTEKVSQLDIDTKKDYETFKEELNARY